MMVLDDVEGHQVERQAGHNGDVLQGDPNVLLAVQNQVPVPKTQRTRSTAPFPTTIAASSGRGPLLLRAQRLRNPQSRCSPT